MKKLLLAILGLCIGFNVFAESPQVQYIKGMYELNASLAKGSITEDNDLNIYNDVDQSFFLDYLDSNIKKIYARNDEYQEATGDMACIDHNVLWQGQDLNPFAKLTFTEPSAGRVKVTIGATRDLEERSVTYQVKCQKDGDCKITEIFEYGKPFTKVTSKCLDDFYRTEIKKHKD
ncbi:MULTISPECIES: hypothetical protein [Snodgrassella]|uniref:hypothetical protein n=1 Tax=Snodgrassella TaxID=1193515 RepID=UPI0008156F44|nr:MULTISPECIES: hypothetical protein [Snodgrassella]SCC09508.1 hypothetical protein GA0061082_108131 [Snodgrassella sp. R-53583]